MSNDTGQFRLYMEMLDRRSVRERALVLLTLLVLLVVVWDFLSLGPALIERKESLSEISSISAEISQLKVDMKTAGINATADPDQEGRQQISELKTVIADFDRKLEERLVNLLSPQEMPVLLQRILKQQKGLRLIAMENLRPEPLLQVVEGEAPPPGLYRHALSMELEGSYLKLLAYLKALEQMPNRVFWDILKVESKEFPVSQIQLQIHTLSLTKEWIGV